MRLPLSLATIASRAMALVPPEPAHTLTVRMMASSFAPKLRLTPDPRLAIKVAGLEFPNPLGLAAGFDKNAHVPNPMLDLGFGFVEVGAVTPHPQAGNAKPRVFRLRMDEAIINRYGFNNDGLDVIRERLSNRPRRGIVGVNLGANKEAADRSADYVTGLEGLSGLVDFYTVNISSPNTPGLRALQGRDALHDLLTKVIAQRNASARGTPVFLKVAPDLTDTDKADIVSVARAVDIDGMIVSNTTIDRSDALVSSRKDEKGGLSGAPLFERSTAVLGEFYQALTLECPKPMPLIGVGGVSSARDAYRKILSGASLIQLYTALVYHGPSLIGRIVQELPEFLEADGFETISDAVGAQFR